MKNNLIVVITTVLKKFFYTFLDVSGILLGIFLTGLGIWVITGQVVSEGMGYFIVFLGIAALFIHTGHYFHLTIARWIFGPGTYFYKDSPAVKTENDSESFRSDGL